MPLKPSFVNQYPQIAFPIYELTSESWNGSRSLGSRDPTGSAYVEAVGPVHSVRLAFGEIGDAEVWWTVTSTALGAFDRRKYPSHEQVLAHDISSSARVVRDLKFGAVLMSKVRELTGTPSGDVDPWTIADGVAPEPIGLPIDDRIVEFQAACAGGLVAAGADLGTGTVTVVGSGARGGLALRRVTDPSPYL